MTAEKMNTDNMSRFLVQVSETHEQDFMVMVLDGASSHKCKELKVPGNITLVFLPPYSPELNPAEQIWNTLRRDNFANRVFDSQFAVAGWYAKIGEPTLSDAICDRIVHNSYTIKIDGDSMRKRKSISE